MNAKRIVERFAKEWDNVGFEVTEGDQEKCSFEATDVTAEKYFDDSIYIHGVCYASGSAHIFFTFDQIEESLSSYKLINEFNNKSPWLFAYIMTADSGKKYLELHYCVNTISDEDDMVDALGFSLNNLLDDDTLEDLRPLTKLTF